MDKIIPPLIIPIPTNVPTFADRMLRILKNHDCTVVKRFSNKYDTEIFEIELRDPVIGFHIGCDYMSLLMDLKQDPKKVKF